MAGSGSDLKITVLDSTGRVISDLYLAKKIGYERIRILNTSVSDPDPDPHGSALR